MGIFSADGYTEEHSTVSPSPAELPMKLTSWFPLWLAAAFLISAYATAEDQPTLQRQGPKMLFLGDSITAGGGYIDYVETWYLLHEKTLPTFINLGLASE